MKRLNDWFESLVASLFGWVGYTPNPDEAEQTQFNKAVEQLGGEIVTANLWVEKAIHQWGSLNRSNRCSEYAVESRELKQARRTLREVYVQYLSQRYIGHDEWVQLIELFPGLFDVMRKQWVVGLGELNRMFAERDVRDHFADDVFYAVANYQDSLQFSNWSDL